MPEYPIPPAPPGPPPYPPQAPPPYRTRRLMRSSRERMWAGVAGGMAEYFDIDPSLVRLLWVAATIVTGGLAVPVYILAWIILPRDERPPVGGPNVWSDWSHEFHNETQRLAQEARRMADEAREHGYVWHPTAPTDQPSSSSAEPARDPASDKGTPVTSHYPTHGTQEAWWQSERYIEQRRHRHHPKSTGVVLVALGILLLIVNSGLFTIEWRFMWPLIFIGLGVILLARQAGWGR